MTRLNVNEAWYDAVFASALQPSDSPTADVVAEAISCPAAVRRPWLRQPMAEEFGDHRYVAAGQMRWVRQLAHAAGGGR
jgi:hypothetical protein